jgi:hypothetical protein
MLWSRIFFANVFDRVGGTDYLCCAGLSLGRPHSDTGQEASIEMAEFAKRIAHIAAEHHVSQSRYRSCVEDMQEPTLCTSAMFR